MVEAVTVLKESPVIVDCLLEAIKNARISKLPINFIEDLKSNSKTSVIEIAEITSVQPSTFQDPYI